MIEDLVAVVWVIMALPLNPFQGPLYYPAQFINEDLCKQVAIEQLLLKPSQFRCIRREVVERFYRVRY